MNIRKIEGNKDIAEIKTKIVELASSLEKIVDLSKTRLNNFAQSFLKSGDTILIIGYSSLIEYILRESTLKAKRLHVVITESRPNCEG